MALELRKSTSKSQKFEGRPVLYVVSNLDDPKEAFNETFQAKDILKKNYGAYWNKFEKRWEWTVFKEGDEDLVLKRAVAAVDEANEFLQNKAEKLEPFIKALKDIEEGLAQANTFIKKEDSDKVVNNLKRFIEDLQNEVDERVFDEKIQNYLSFSASRRQFSLRNTLLLFIQNPNAKDARSKTNWGIVDRVPKGDAQPIILFRPPLRPMSPSEKERVEAAFRKSLGVGPNDRLMPADYKRLQAKLKNGVPKSSNPESFIPYPVFDVTDTEPIKDGVGELPEEPKWFSSEPNEKADLLKDSLVAAARKIGIQVNEVQPEEDDTISQGAKGYSAGGKIVLDATVEGVGIFSVMVHETAHEILHQEFLKTQSKDNKTSKEQGFEDLYVGRDSSKIQELQAEATAYVVLKNYGLQNTASATYLVLFRNDRKNIQEHLEVITRTANKIINMIGAEMGDASLNENDMNEELNVSQVAKMLGVNMNSDNNLDESTDNDRYEEVVFLQGEHADEALYILNQKGEEAALEYLKQWHYFGEHPGTTQIPHGSGDEIFEKDGYTMSYSTQLNYIGLIYDLQHGKMRHEPHAMGNIPLNESVRALIRMQLSESVLKKNFISESSSGQYEIYHETLSSALDEVRRFLSLKDYEADERDLFMFGVGGISYGVTKRYAFDLTKSGEPSKNQLQVQIYRLDSGRYELNMYYNNSNHLKEYSERNAEDYPWYCQDCDEELQWFDVTNDEMCAKCGSDVIPNEEAASYEDMEPDDLSDIIMDLDEGEHENFEGEMEYRGAFIRQEPTGYGKYTWEHEQYSDYSTDKGAYGFGNCSDIEDCKVQIDDFLDTINEGLWDNIRKKRARGEKPAKPGDKDYPDAKAWKKAQTSEGSYQDHLDTFYSADGMDDYYAEKESYREAERLYDKGQELFNKGEAEKAEALRQEALRMASEWSDTELPPYDELSQEEWNEANAILENRDGWEECKPSLEEAEYRGRKVKLNKPMRGDVKKFKVYVKNDKGNVVKVNFGEKGARIKKDNPKRRKSFRARHNCDNPGPKWKARYWSCKKW